LKFFNIVCANLHLRDFILVIMEVSHAD
jgi:hypothetical protein